MAFQARSAHEAISVGHEVEVPTFDASPS